MVLLIDYAEIQNLVIASLVVIAEMEDLKYVALRCFILKWLSYNTSWKSLWDSEVNRGRTDIQTHMWRWQIIM